VLIYLTGKWGLSMDSIGVITKWQIVLFGQSISYNPVMLMMTWIVMAIIVILAILSTRKMKKKPGKLQMMMELFYKAFRDLTYSTLGEEMGKAYVPYIATLFIFLLLSNYIGILPPVFQFFHMILYALDNGGLAMAASDSAIMLGPILVLRSVLIVTVILVAANLLMLLKKKKDFKFGITKYFYLFIAFLFVVSNWMIPLPIPDFLYAWMAIIPVFQEPTKFLSTPLSLGLLSAVVVHVSAIKYKGLKGYLGSYMDPLPSEGIWMFLFWINPFWYLNVIGEMAKVVSHSFRLFGNILGGSIIIVIVSNLTYFMLPMPAFLNAFFGLFTGAIQAFVFTMLAVTYIAVTAKD